MADILELPHNFGRPIAVGTAFQSKNAFRDAIEDWSIRDGFSFHASKSLTTRVRWVCEATRQGVACPWFVYAMCDPHDLWIVQTGNQQHNCVGAGAVLRPVKNRQHWLKRRVPLHLTIRHTTKPDDIQNCISKHYRVRPSYDAAQLCRQALLREALTEQREQYKKIPAYLARLRATDLGERAELKTIQIAEGAEHYQFQRVFICPA